MLIGYNRPTTLDGLNISGGENEAEIVTDQDFLVDGSPGTPTRFLLPNGVSVAYEYQVGEVFFIDFDFMSNPRRPRIACLLGVTLPVNTLVLLDLRPVGGDFDDSPFYSGPSGVVTQLPDGSRCVWWQIDNLAEGLMIDGYRVVVGLYNSETPIVPQSYMDIGEFCVWEAMEVDAKAGSAVWSINEATSDDRSLMAQSFPDYELSYRQFSCQLVPRTPGQTWGRVDDLAYAMGRGRLIAVLPYQYGLDASGVDYSLFVRQAIAGVATEVPGIGHVWHRIYGNERITVREIPALPAYVIEASTAG